MPRFILTLAVAQLLLFAHLDLYPQAPETEGDRGAADDYEHPETRELVQLVREAAGLLEAEGEEAAFTEFRRPGTRWRRGDDYIFVFDLQGNMLVHPDRNLEGTNQIDLTDVNGKPIIRGMIDSATSTPGSPDAWYHYEWPVPGGLLPRWKSTYVRLVTTPFGEDYIVGSGIYTDRMERSFVIDAVEKAVGAIEENGEAAFQQLRDPTGPFLAKDTYIFVIDREGNELVNPAFPYLEGQNLLNMTDTQGKPLVREMLELVETEGSGWIDYFWPQPGESVSTEKATYVSKADLGTDWVLVGCGVYLADAPKKPPAPDRMTASQLETLVREAASVFGQQGQEAFAEFREEGSKWFHGDTYFFVWTLDGTRIFHAANPESEGENVRNLEDVMGRPIGEIFLEIGRSPSGEGWGHYLYPEPGNIFPTWKSTFVKRVKFPTGDPYLIGCGIYNMDMDPAFIVDVVERAAALIEAEGERAFDRLRDKTGPFRFMDTYVFVTRPDGTELVNPAQPSLEGKDLSEVRDVHGKLLVQDYVDAALEKGSAWVDYVWYKPGDNTPAQKRSYVRKVQFDDEVYIIGSGFYPASQEAGTPQPVSE